MSDFGEDDKTGYNLSLPIKPIAKLNSLYDEINLIGDKFTVNKDTIFTFFGNDSEPCLIFITQGRFSVHRRYDDLLMHSSSAPSLFGLVEYFQPRKAHFVLADTECKGIKVNVKLACEIFNQNQSWESLCHIQTYLIQVLQIRDLQLVGVNAYLVIKNKLIELIQEPEDVRLRQSVLLYIQQRSKLSKSLISKILSALRTGNYIDMKRGKLVSINCLPKDY